MQTDFTCGNELGVTIGGEAFPHLLCHPVLPYSNWGGGTVCRSESMAAMKRGVRGACLAMGGGPAGGGLGEGGGGAALAPDRQLDRRDARPGGEASVQPGVPGVDGTPGHDAADHRGREERAERRLRVLPRRVQEPPAEEPTTSCQPRLCIHLGL